MLFLGRVLAKRVYLQKQLAGILYIRSLVYIGDWEKYDGPEDTILFKN
jgi:hypothetical protein